MANSAGVTNSFKDELMHGIHALGTTVVRAATTKDTLKLAVYLASATIVPGTQTYTSSGEIPNSGDYTAGGATLSNANEPALDGTVAHWTPSAAVTLTGVTFGANVDCALVYNSTQGNKTVSVHTFGATNVTGGNFVLNMPTNNGTTGLVRIA